MTDLTGKTAIVTGADAAWGALWPLALEAGATVALVELDRDVLDEAVKKIGDGCIGIAADVSARTRRNASSTRRLALSAACISWSPPAWPGTVPRYRPFQRQNDLGNHFTDWQLFRTLIPPDISR